MTARETEADGVDVLDLKDAADVGTATAGHADYVLHDRRGRPLAVVEAKRNAIHSYQPVVKVRVAPRVVRRPSGKVL